VIPIPRFLIRIPAAVLVIAKFFFVLCVTVQAETPAEMQTEIEIARLRIKIYENHEYPLKRSTLDSKIRVAKVRIESLERQKKEYEQFTKFKYSSPMIGELERVYVALVEAEEDLKNLSHEKILLQRFHQDRMRLMRLELQRMIELANP